MGDRTDPPESKEPLSILAWVDRIANVYEAAWKSVKLPRIEDFLGDAPDERRAALLEELLRIENAYRAQLKGNNFCPACAPSGNPTPADPNVTALSADDEQSARDALETQWD